MARDRDEVTLPCDNVIENQNQCDQTSWLYSPKRGRSAVELISFGQIGKSEIAEDKSNRLSVTADCSLVIKDVTSEDVGGYSCRQFNRAGQQQGGDALVVLSDIWSEYLHDVFSSNCLVRITYRDIILIMITVMKLISLFSLFSLIISQSSPVNEKQNGDQTTLDCYVFRYDIYICEHTVQWLFDGNFNDTETKGGSCSASVTFPTRYLSQKSKFYESLKCNVTDNRSEKTLLFLPSLEKTVTGLNVSYIMARRGDEVTLPCDNVIKHQHKCDETSWLHRPERGRSAEELISLGQIGKSEIAEDKSNRLSVTADCSLVIKDVEHQDIGRYSCRQFNRAGQQQGGDALVVLSVIYIDEEQNGDQTLLKCFVFRYGGCKHTVQWLFDGNNNDVETTTFTCSARVTFPTPHPSQKSKFYESLKCNVTDNRSGETLLFQSSLEKTVTGLNVSYIMARDGDEVTLPCDNVIENQHKCDQTTWLHSPKRGRSAVELISLGQIGKSEIAEAKSNRLSVTADCSLVIKDVEHQDIGRYSCRQFNRAGQQQGGDALVVLSVIYSEYLHDVFSSNCPVRIA
ncbi:uncharacterized protein LOC131991295 isoform X2 [Centropristis striata]|nr:uncharacterized protein LOC131991295 isoform X2 [Centropristis striata]